MPARLAEHLAQRATAGVITNAVVFSVVANLAVSRASHGALSPAGLVAVVAGASVAATCVGWVAGLFDGAAAALDGRVVGIAAAPADALAGRGPWRDAARWAAWSAAWSGSGAVVLAAVLRHQSAPFPVVLVALVALSATAAVVVDAAARAAGAAVGAALAEHRPEDVTLHRRAWRDLALPVGAVQLVVNAAAAWVLFHGRAAAGTLTEQAAFEDIVLVAALVATLFGALGVAWGRFDAAVGRVAPDPDTTAGRTRPLGPQGIVYAGALAVLAVSVARLAVPSNPSLLRVALVRGLVAGTLALLVTGLAVVRGAANTAPADLGPRPPFPPGTPAPARSRRGTLVGAGAAAAVALAVVLLSPLGSRPLPAAAQTLDELGLVAELDAFAVRVEYDIPLPAGTGSAPEVVGTIRRANGAENANGIAAAPSNLDPVVGGRLSDPDSRPGTGDENRVPRAECAYPGALVDVAFVFPTDIRTESGGTPPIGHSRAHCDAGPVADLHAVTATPEESLSLGPAVTVGGGAADGHAAPVDGVLSAEASARASDISILDGVVRIASVDAHGHSRTDGSAGGGATDAAIDITGITIAGVEFALRGGDLVIGDTSIPVASPVAGAFLSTLSMAVAPSGCDVAVLDAPATYPQGFLFLRPEPELGVADDGSLAASMQGGLVVTCDLPQSLTGATDFNPQRVQVALGFAYTGVAARADIGGFGLDDLAGGAPGGDGGNGGGLAPPAVDTDPVVASGVIVPPAVAGPTTPASDEPPAGPLAPVFETVRHLAANFAAGRPWVWVAALVSWMVLTHRGLERLRRSIDDASA